MTDPSTRGWGGPGCTATQLVRVQHPQMQDAAPAGGFPLRVRAEVAPLFAELVRWLVANRSTPLVCAGGYNKRLIAGSDQWSNHSWGLAADFNPATNPMRSSLRTDMPAGTSAKAKSLGMRWGGDYAGRKDPMHFEFMGTPDDAARLVVALRPSRDRDEEDEMTPAQMAEIKKHVTGAVDYALADLTKRLAGLDEQVKILRRDTRELGKAAGIKVSGATDGVVGN